MKWKKSKIAPRNKDKRMSQDAETVIEFYQDNWDLLMESLQNFNQQDRDELQEHFDSAVDGRELGELMVAGDWGEFKDKIVALDENEQQLFKNAVEEAGIFEM